MNLTVFDSKGVAVYVKHCRDLAQVRRVVMNSPYLVRTNSIIYKGVKYSLEEVRETFPKTTIKPHIELYKD